MMDIASAPTTTSFTLSSLLICVGFVITIIGMFLSWRSSHQKSNAIEIKVDGQMTTMQDEISAMTTRVMQLETELTSKGMPVPDKKEVEL
jgi:uncharacterized membrane protein